MPAHLLAIALLFAIAAMPCQAQLNTAPDIEKATKAGFAKAISEFRDFLQVPNDGHYPAQIAANIGWATQAFQSRGFKTQLIETPGAPHVYAEKQFVKKGKTVLFYLQIDGQPVDTSAWDQESPYKAALKEGKNGQWQEIDWSNFNENFNPDWRIYARSASDSKGPAMCFLTALSILEEHKVKPNFNIKVIMDFQEEMGSPQLAWVVKNNQELLKSDMLLIMDGTRHVSNLPTLCFGARGIATATLKVYGPRNALHSGQYGNYAPNPVFALSKLLAGLKDDSGRVTLPGFYDGIVLSEADKKSLNDIPEDMDAINATLGIARQEAVGATYQEAMQYPSLNVRGIRAAWVGKEVRTVIPEEAIAEIDMRLVPEAPGEKLMDLLKNYIQAQGFHLVEGVPTDEERSQYPKLASLAYKLGSGPFRTDIGTELGEWLSRAHYKLFGEHFVKMRTTGGSQPIAPFIKTLNVPAVSVRIPNPDNSIHGPNENIRVGNFFEGIETMVGVLTEKL
ncbi:MAG: M20/M25/M40 family metallo-hydrolase [Cyclobacteriaceae bacterium]|nr:M20/M25/M40 family metallo-hydrolase [Cyclobacteriaceae bacterium]MCB0498126.1 M20/M25/M40 family metallo-hydrolase [Cyclobacteriaceae bacterium]MCB9238850.1 M20/M25/M40 family metallo-hydrolase [Flammeovirgaceae bacterium]MCO5270569.1 M20/M25/M40 family metallo-hydrolase [Cyclobacteriaceae bacterium]MCW5900990.1 M20/M25/M40 family metallo-hydrolase [Cyclobacteriaceae bacterium]